FLLLSSSFFILLRPLPTSPLFPYTTLFRSNQCHHIREGNHPLWCTRIILLFFSTLHLLQPLHLFRLHYMLVDHHQLKTHLTSLQDRKSTRLNSSHVSISYAVFCLKKKIIFD